MKNEDQSKMNLEGVENASLFEEVAKRLKGLYRGEHGMDFMHGCFEFIFHDGRFQGVEDRPRYKRYRSPGRLSPVPA